MVSATSSQTHDVRGIRRGWGMVDEVYRYLSISAKRSHQLRRCAPEPVASVWRYFKGIIALPSDAGRDLFAIQTFR
jgi:hypothetical protein